MKLSDKINEVLKPLDKALKDIGDWKPNTKGNPKVRKELERKAKERAKANKEDQKLAQKVANKFGGSNKNPLSGVWGMQHASIHDLGDGQIEYVSPRSAKGREGGKVLFDHNKKEIIVKELGNTDDFFDIQKVGKRMGYKVKR